MKSHRFVRIGAIVASAAAGAAFFGSTAAHAAQGLVAPPAPEVWPTFQARLAVGAESALPVSLVGDYYFRPAVGGGFRATSGVLGDRRLWGSSMPLAFGGPRAFRGSAGTGNGGFTLTPEPHEAAPPAAYVGVGYSGPILNTGISLVADFGVVAEGGPRPLLGTQGTERALRELRLSPLLQLGVRYAF